MPRLSLKARVDEYGRLKAKVAELNEKIEKLRDGFARDIEDGDAEGTLFKVTVSPVTTNRTDWKGLAESYTPSKRKVAKYTEVSESTRVTVSAR